MHVIDQTKTPKVTLQAGNLKAEFLPTGDLYRLGTEETMINQVLSNPIDGALNNLYLRVYQEDGSISYAPLLGIQSHSQFALGKNQVKWTGVFEEISYAVIFSLANYQTWLWYIKLEGKKEKIDVIYAQDIGLASQAAVQTNEAYTAQYVDHSAFDGVICSRQNMPQGEGKFPYLQQGAFSKVASYSTDGFQFFGTSYKETNVAQALTRENLPSQVSQYEFSYTALQIKPFQLVGKETVTFYGYFEENHPEAVTAPKVIEANGLFQSEEMFTPIKQLKCNPLIGEPLKTIPLTNEEMAARYPKRIQEENEGNQWLSFFTEDYVHVVSKAKELLVERPHGHILFTGGNRKVDESIMTTTCWMYGVFNAQTLRGNTDMNKWFTNTRNALNILNTSGQRLYVKIKDTYHLLAMPSVFEMGFNYAKWLYKTSEETFEVTVFSTIGNSEIRLQLETKSGQAYEYLVTNQVVMNQKEYVTPVYMKQDKQALTFYADKNTLNYDRYPELAYQLVVEGTEFTVKDESLFVTGAEPGSASLMVLQLVETNQFQIRMLGNDQASETTFGEEVRQFKAYFNDLMNGFKLTKGETLPSELEKLNIIAWWYTHNMLVHYLVPHGLEQYGGAAWGTRDVSQGPAEYFLTMQHYDVVKEIIKTLFSHQFVEDGNWPQWFMFDRYQDIYFHESHGDIIVWPLKLVADYLYRSGDTSILQETVPYMSRETSTFTTETFTVRHHLEKEIDYIKSHFLWDTHLSSYGDGDWDDTLQPHGQSLKVNMASSWTVALTYEALTRFSETIKEVESEYAKELTELATYIKADYNKYILSDDVIPGFVYMPEPDKVEFMIHPTDTKTGIQYRLLPMIQGITSEIFTKEQAITHFQLIKEHLSYPDGVRLMNRPATYQGGVSTNFKRAEQAANFGREVGLLYVHAQIRFIESMAKIGKTAEVWHGLEVINPINIQDVVPNAAKRQSNSYFSSSDGDFASRYEVAENFEKLKTGEVPVKGGWRIYSSGPGIYLNQLISNVLGISTHNQDLVIDPILPATYSGLTLQFTYLGKAVTFKFMHDDNEVIVVNGKVARGAKLMNPYRTSGMAVMREEIEPLLNNMANVIEVYY
ncbi:GH36-type glycosyl hydrolase domain-containing protein [Jeotgalibaca sp. A122]|uniref:GH36-type glycosyl hydrolase domain-containing protein n=1 Tax=Jeotgalibaca sp. A122 TaxID=3457322 RepID=UPI003FD6BC24